MMKNMKVMLFAAATMIPGSLLAADDAGWRFGLGTGYMFTNFDGDIYVSNGLVGTTKMHVDADYKDVSDSVEGGFGFTGYAKKDKWSLGFGYGDLNLEWKEYGPAAKFKTELGLTGAHLSLGYELLNNEMHHWETYGGVRYTHHKITTNRTTATSKAKFYSVNEDWVDGFIGLAYSYKFAPDWFWANKMDVGAGGADISATFNSSLGWRFAPNWTGSVYAQTYALEYEDGSKGSANYYKYDVRQYGAGLGIAYEF